MGRLLEMLSLIRVKQGRVSAQSLAACQSVLDLDAMQLISTNCVMVVTEELICVGYDLSTCTVVV